MTQRVAVLGGGIAGAAAALRLAQKGVRPVWIAAPGGTGFKPGEHLSAAAIPLLKILGSDALLRAEVHRYAHATYSAWGSEMLIERNAIVQLEGPPVVLDRGAFEDALTAQALVTGAERIDRDVTEVRIVGNSWDFMAGDIRIGADFVFDATGRKAIVASKFAQRFQADKLSCMYALFARPAAAPVRPVTLIEAEERGWWYLSALPDGQCVVTFYTDSDLPSFAVDEFDTTARRTRAISTFLDEYDLTLQDTAKRVTTNSNWIAPAVGPGWVAIGDAAAAFDPLSSHGMTTALWSAIEAADAFAGQDRRRMHRYADAVAKGVQEYLVARRAVYSLEKRWAQCPFWRRRQAVDPTRKEKPA